MPVQSFRLFDRKRSQPYACLEQVGRGQLLKMGTVQHAQVIGTQFLHGSRESEIYAGFNQKGVRQAAIATRPRSRAGESVRLHIDSVGLGLLKLFTCGVFFIFTIIDWFLIMGAARSANIRIAGQIKAMLA